MLHLKSTGAVLEEHGNSTPVGVRTAALFVRRGIGRLRRVVQQPKRQDRIAAKVIEVSFLEIKRQRQATHQGLGQILHFPNVGDHDAA